MMFKADDKILSTKTAGVGTILCVLDKCQNQEENLFYIEFCNEDGRKEHHIYAQSQITAA